MKKDTGSGCLLKRYATVLHGTYFEIEVGG